MFECHRIEQTWVDKCNRMDEIWVPSTFNIQTFSASGVDQNKMKVIPLGVDSDKYRPALEPMTIPGKRKYTFLSICHFDLRKGIDILIRIFAREFKDEDVCLIIKTRASSQEEIHNQQAMINQSVMNEIGRSLDSIILISTIGAWTEEQMAQLYISADCYVLPTRGEGWNLTIMEAMACVVPVITTSWSAHLDFVNQSNGYLISCHH